MNRDEQIGVNNKISRVGGMYRGVLLTYNLIIHMLFMIMGILCFGKGFWCLGVVGVWFITTILLSILIAELEDRFV